ncbi:MAG: hypothetical protein HC845_14480 [Akkermansiaceae bacterium]|nr:hypothetical protein [Akkermansiaceae bacterium]
MNTMIKYIAAAALALVFSVASASAQAKAKLFKGNYDGIANMESTDGTIFVSYSPIRFKVDAKGNIRGTAARNRDLLGNSINPPVVMQFTGSSKKLKLSALEAFPQELRKALAPYQMERRGLGILQRAKEDLLVQHEVG